MTPNERLRSARRLLGISQSDFANLLNIKQRRLSNIERGRVIISPKLMSRLVDLGISREYLETGEGEPIARTIAARRDRFFEAINHIGHSTNLDALSGKTGILLQELTEIIDGSIPSLEVVHKLTEAFPSVNFEWLLEDEGVMIKKEQRLRSLEMSQREKAQIAEAIRANNEKKRIIRALLQFRPSPALLLNALKLN